MIKQGRCDVVDKLKKILSYIALPVTLLIGWLIGRFARSESNDGSGTAGTATAQLDEAGRDLSRAGEDLGRVKESASGVAGSLADASATAERLSGSVSTAADKADRLGIIDKEYGRLAEENRDILDELISRAREEAEYTEDDDSDSSYPF